MNSIKQATVNFQQGYSCSQSVLLAFAEQYGISQEIAARLTSGFGGGMGRMGRTCGAVSGAVMVLGLSRGEVNPGDKEAKARTYDLVRSYQEEFKRRCGNLDCSALIGVDISTPEGLAQARAEGRFNGCTRFVEEAARLLSEVLAQQVMK